MNYQDVVRTLRSLVQGQDQTLTDAFKRAAVDYAEACRAVNARLQRCEEFLQRGLRSEAVYVAEVEPAVLDLVAVLQFQERPELEQLLLTYGLPAPPPLQLA